MPMPMRRRMPARRRLAFALPLVLLLGACAVPQRPPAVLDPPQLVVERVVLRHRVGFATDSDRITPQEETALRRFLAALPSSPLGAVRVLGHADERLGRTYNLDLAARRARAVARLLRELGLEQVDVDVRAFGELAPRAQGRGEEAWRQNRRVLVEVEVARVVVPACPDWSKPDGIEDGEAASSGWGCASAANLAAMIADPADLIAPPPLEAAGSVRAARAVERYRLGPAADEAGETVE